MDMNEQQPGVEGEYVLVHKSKAKISRFRKAIIGVMAVGAVSALAGAGTFASFSASTTNSAAFSTARMALRNGGPSGCVSPAGQTGTGVSNSAVDTNEVLDSTSATSSTDCPSLFPNPLKPGESATATVTIDNVGDVDAALYLFAEAACAISTNLATYDRGTATNLCNRVVMSVRRTSGTADCLYGAEAVEGTCDTLGQSSTSTFADFSANKQFANKITALSSLSKDGTDATFEISVYWLLTQGSTACNLVIPGGTATDSNTDGYVDATGQGCDNPYMNQKASLKMRWQIQG